MESDKIQPGTMLLNPRGFVGWVVEVQRIKTLIGEYDNYTVEWSGGNWLDNLTTGQVHVYHEQFLKLQNGK